MTSFELDCFCGFAERFLTDEGGHPLVIERFQRQILADYFDGARETIVLLSKKNGKTSLFAALALWHTITVQFADVAILAASRDQAGKLLQQLTGYIKRAEELRRELRITQRAVHCDRTDGKVAVLAADADTLDGWGGTLALVDELGRHKSEENFGLLRDGLGPRNGQLVAFSTAGDSEDSALGRLRVAAHDMAGFARDPGNPKHKLVRASGFVSHEWSLAATTPTISSSCWRRLPRVGWTRPTARSQGVAVDAGLAMEAFYVRTLGRRRGLGIEREGLGRVRRSGRADSR
jgi:hypothetical protein